MKLGKFARLFRMGVLLNADSTIKGYNESPNSVTLRVPYIYQNHVNLCADASAMMILLAWGFEPNRGVDENPRLPFKGSRIEEHTNLVEGGAIWDTATIGKVNKPTNAEFLFLLKHKGPLGVSTKGHSQVLIGIDNAENTVILHDPWKGPNKVNTFQKFINEMVEYTWLRQVGVKKLTPDAKWKN